MMTFSDQLFSKEETERSLECLFSHHHGSVMNVQSGKVIAAQGQEVSSVFRIDRGYVRICVYTESGLRRVVAFCGAGTVIGIDQLNSPSWNVSVEAVTQCVLTAVPKAVANRRIEADCTLREGVMCELQSEIEQREAHLVMMGILPSTERVYAFLTAFADMRGRDGFLVLPMCRRDIGDYLGLSMETVSRSFSALREAGRIELNGAERFRIADKELAPVDHRAA